MNTSPYSEDEIHDSLHTLSLMKNLKKKGELSNGTPTFSGSNVSNSMEASIPPVPEATSAVVKSSVFLSVFLLLALPVKTHHSIMREQPCERQYLAIMPMSVGPSYYSLGLWFNQCRSCMALGQT